jgi:mannose-1-phosphate guanylyltransferase/mannose-6-phosphate isomerase
MSRTARPKQLLPLVAKEPLLVTTWKRALRLAPKDRIWVVAPKHLAPAIRKTIPDLRRANLVVEPSPRDTAPAIGLACAAVAVRDPEAVVGVFPTDHVIRRPAAFVRSVRVAAAEAKRGALVCLGVTPDRPATGFGYLECAARPSATRAVAVRRFVEKPDLPRAQRFLASGSFLWNAGMFVWKASRFLDELGKRAPATLRAARDTAKGTVRSWGQAEKLSVDYAVMEKASGVKVVALEAGWDDVGSWHAAARVREEASVREPGEILVESDGSVVFGSHRTVAVVGLPGIVVVDTADALLVAARDRSEEVRKVVEELRRRKREDLLR